MRRFFGCVCGAIVAYSFAHAMGIPFWRDWDVGDCFDISTSTFCALWFLAPAALAKANP